MGGQELEEIDAQHFDTGRVSQNEISLRYATW